MITWRFGHRVIGTFDIADNMPISIALNKQIFCTMIISPGNSVFRIDAGVGIYLQAEFGFACFCINIKRNIVRWFGIVI